tara:strand:+ start:74 stop:418 length:345 start_codon:yes stop_codon:yes gene_type:complete
MPTKKTTTASAPKSPPVAKKPIAKKEVVTVSHDHSALESDIDSLKKEVSSLKLALAESIIAHKESDAALEANILALKSADATDSNSDDLVNQIILVLKQTGNLAMRRALRARKL